MLVTGVLHCPVGGEPGTVALYRTAGPFLHTVSLSASSERVQAGKTFVLEVSGKLAGRPDQPTGIQSRAGQDFSYVTVEFLGVTPKVQSSRHVSLLDDGSFSVSCEWFLETPGKYQINVSVSNLLSTLSSSLHLSVLQPSPDNGAISGPVVFSVCAHLQNSQNTAVCQTWFNPGNREEDSEMKEEEEEKKRDCVKTEDSFPNNTLIYYDQTFRLALDLKLHEDKCDFSSSSSSSSSSSKDNNSCRWDNVGNESKKRRYNVTVKAVNWTLFQTHVLVQDPVGELMLSVPRVIRTDHRQPVSFSVAAGSDMTVSLLVNATQVYRNCTYAAGEEVTVVLLFDHTGASVVELRAENRVSSQNKNVRVCAEGDGKSSLQVRANSNWQPPASQSPANSEGHDVVQIFAAKSAYLTNKDITFLAVADPPDNAEFTWHFGDSTSVRTTSRTVTKRYHKPGKFAVVVVMSAAQTSITSAVFPLIVQRAVKLNRLVHQPSVLQNQTVNVSCRVNVGTNLTFLWSFGDGSCIRLGQSTEQHVFHRTGEFTVEVTVSNLVSSASLKSHIFVVDQPCQPPPVKNMGPLKLQVQRYEVIRLGVTYDTELDCDSSGGLHYTWTLLDSAGRSLHLPFTDTHRQSLTLQSYFLQYDTYTATARVQVIDSVVYSNYSVNVQVMPSSPVAVIQGGTNVFINNRNTTVITLDGRRSYDPDFPKNPLSYSWTCKPLSSITTSCFHQHISTSSPVLTFPVSLLKRNFDQFQFTLTVESAERSASAETFLTVAPHVLGKLSLSCPRCQGNQVSWDWSFSVSTSCEDCDVSPHNIQYSWSLYLVNASSKHVVEVPFCHTVDLSAPSTISEGPAEQLQTPEISSLPDTHYTAAPLLTEITSERAEGTELDPSENHDSQFDRSKDFHGFSSHSDSSSDWEMYFPDLGSGDFAGELDSDYDVPFPSAEEGEPGSSAGRPTGADGETFSPGDDSAFDPAAHEGDGSNLVVSRPSVVTQQPTLLDLPRDPVDRVLFDSYTYTGISSPVLSVRPFSLRPGSRYMLELTAKSRDRSVGQTQLFLETKPVPEGARCQVQPVTGSELHTHFSVFCTSGKEDLLYEYSFSVGGKQPRVLYHGRDFQYYFNLPSGDPSDDYKVTIYTEIRSSTYGTTTKPCPVTVQVQPGFLRDTSPHHDDPDLELSGSGLRNLSALVKLGNSREIGNYISLLSSVLNRLSLDTEANTQAQRHVRCVLICTLCELQSGDQASILDSVSTLKDLLQVTNQVTLSSVRHVTLHIQAVSYLFVESSTAATYHLDHKTLSTLVVLLSYNLQAAVTNRDFTPETHNADNITHVRESDSHNCCIRASATGDLIAGGLTSAEQTRRLVVDVLQTASDLMLTYILFHKVQQHRVSTDLLTLYATYQNQTSTVISSGSTTFYIPTSLVQLLFVHHSRATERRQRPPCVLGLLTELATDPYTSTRRPTQFSGPVVDLSLYKCNTRRKIPVRSLVLPVSVQLRHPPGNRSSVHEHVLVHTQVNYHSFNLTQDHLHQAVQLSVEFTPPPNKVFPVMLLFRMFEKPTPSMHHLRRIHDWESDSICITLPPSYLNAGVGHLALLNAEFGKAHRHKHLSEQISYSLTLVSSQCLSWDDHQGAWTHRGCRTQRGDTTSAVNCSCHQLRPLTVVQHHIQSSNDTSSLEPFLSVSQDLTVLAVLVLCACLCLPVSVACRREDADNEKHRRVHYLSDNSPFDPCLYAVTIYTGLCSAATMTSKVYVTLYGEDGVSHTKELQVPGCTLFRRNSQDTFLLSAAESLGSVWGVHIWHDGSGPSPDWYLKHVEVSEVNSRRAWLFLSQCWLAVSKGDGQVERMLRVCTHGLGFAEMLRFKLSDLLADFHIWMSVYSCPCPSLFTHAQRLGVCLLLLLGYSCVNTVIISQMDDQLPFELGFLDVSAVSVATGLLSVVAVLPGATGISCLFRLREVKRRRSGVQQGKGRKTEKGFVEDSLSVNDSVAHASWNKLEQWLQEAWRKTNQGTDGLPLSTTILENKDTDKEPVNRPDVIITKEDDPAVKSSLVLQNLTSRSKQVDDHETMQGKQLDPADVLSGMKDEDHIVQNEKVDPGGKCRYHATDKLKGRRNGAATRWCHRLAWTLCLLLCLCCLVLSALLGMRFSSSKLLLWIHSLFFSLVFCIFIIQPAVIVAVAATVSFWHRKRADFHSFTRIEEFEVDLCSCTDADGPEKQFKPQETCSDFEKLLAARQRARYLRLVHPPTPAELRRSRGRKRRGTLIHNTLRDLCVCVSMIFLMLCVTHGSSFSDRYHLNQAVRKHFIRNNKNCDFMSIQNHEDWWRWIQTKLLNVLYKNTSTINEQSHILIGEPILWKTGIYSSLQEHVFGHTFPPESLFPDFTATVPTVTPMRTCGHLGCYAGHSTASGLGHTKSDAASRLTLLRSDGWLDRRTVALKVQFTLFSPAPNLYTSVTLLTEQSPTSVLLPSSKVQSVRVYSTPAVWDYVVMVCQLVFLLLSLLQFCLQMCTLMQQGLMGYWKTPCNWLEVALLTVTLVRCVYYAHHSIVITDAAELLQRRNGHVDVSFLASWEQDIRTLCGLTLFLLTLKCVTVLRGNETLASSATLFTRSLCSLCWPMVSGLILLVALSCAGNLLFVQRSWAFSSIPRSLQTLLCRCGGVRPLRSLLLSGRDFLFCGTLYLSSTMVWTAVVIAVVSTLVRRARRSESRRDTVFTVAEMGSYITQRLSEFVLKREPKWIDDHVESRTFYLEEFESLVDELLFRLNALSNCLHHTLPPKLHHDAEEKDSPIASPTREALSMDTWDFGGARMAEEKLRSMLELEMLQCLQQRSQQRNTSDTVVASTNQQQPEEREEEEENPGLNRPSLQESASVIEMWTEDVMQTQDGHWINTNDSCWISKTQATHTEVVVEVLVHDEPGDAESDTGGSIRLK
ncbi:polycystin-1-like protein 1 [Solea solea]|uniref:polycystin-1-like protein 1 n=1 Tax=Solea solea TaxID=90069 RepID=UPI00272DA093|nr:polycystin-1-like protein 1 [Solea solea]